MIRIRPAGIGDNAVVGDMLALAATWRNDPAAVHTNDVLSDSLLARYVNDWPRPGDAGVIAEQDDRHPVGAAWYRFFSANEPGFGFVSPTTPEVSVAVIATRRGAGIGTSLLRHLLDVARAQGVRQLSLSVEHDNPARHLYRRLGFTPVDGGEAAITMVVELTGR